MIISMSKRFLESNVNWIDLNVCDHWNSLEKIIIDAIDEEAPLRYVKSACPSKTSLSLVTLRKS